MLDSLPEEITDEQRKGDTPERHAAQIYYNLAIDDIKSIINEAMKGE